MLEWTIGVISGSGLYAMENLEDAQWLAVDTPWGLPSDDVLIGRVEGVKFVFLPRHGRGHRLPPDAINYRANVDALKRAGCTDLIALSAVGSLREELAPGRFVVVDQYIDRTMGRANSFFGPGLVAHVSLADPVCPRLSALAADAGETAGAMIARGGCYIAIEGPQFSTRAESRMYRAWGGDVIGMTGMPEARLAREAEIPYASVCMVTDYDCWRDDTAAVDVAEILAQLEANAGTARRLLVELARRLQKERAASPIDTALDHAIITARDARDPAFVARLDAVAGRGTAERRMKELPPYARFLGIRLEQRDDELIHVMPFSDVVLGRPGFLHGGAIAGLLEFAAFGALFEALGDESVRVKPVNVTVQFMRGGVDHDTFATGLVTRLGKRVANIEAHAWQRDRAKPIASAQMNMMLRRGETLSP